MSEKEKAEELIELMDKQTYRYGYEAGKKCAIVFANETIKHLIKIKCRGKNDIDENIKYWKDVMSELKNN